MAEWSTAYVNDLPDSAFACVDSEGRHYPHHDAQGKLDLPHLRAAMSRIGDASNTQCGKAHLMAHAKSMGMGQKSLVELKATILDDDAIRILAIPFGGPLPSAHNAKGVDMDHEFFSERTDLKLDWFDVRLVDWHHRHDAKLGDAVIGKAVDPEMDEDGWWVTAWLKKSSRYLAQIRRLMETGVPIFGSSEAVPGMTKKASTGEILVWPYVRQTLSPLPRNTFSVIRPLKATIDDLASEDGGPTEAFFDDLARYLDNLGSDPAPEGGAKAGRVLAGRNEARLREAMDLLDAPYDESFREDTKRRKQAIAAIQSVLEELDQYLKPVAL